MSAQIAKKNSTQNPNAVIMVRPAAFFPNQETAADNAFQTHADQSQAANISAKAQSEFDAAVQQLINQGITVHVFEDTPIPHKPDAVFPNNWFSTHADGTLVLYPMYAPVRRLERRDDVVTFLKSHYRVKRIIDLSNRESNNVFLEGTGSLVIDHDGAIAYVALSHRAHKSLVAELCDQLQLQALTFSTADAQNTPIYHTNVMMGIGRYTAVICLDSIVDADKRKTVIDTLNKTNKTIIEISLAQMNRFAGNVIELQGTQGPILVLSETALKCFTAEQKARLEQVVQLCPLSIPTIEMGGGSARCMIAGVHLPSIN